MKTYSIEQIMAAWSKYKLPVYYYNGKKVSERTFKGLFSTDIVYKTETDLRMIDRYEDLHIDFPSYLAEVTEKL